MAPQIGIALALYQPDLKFLREQLDSIQSQTYKDWVCRIGADSDLKGLRAESVLQPFFEDARFRWVQNPARLGHRRNFESGIQGLLELGVSAIACSDQDDVWFDDKLEAMYREWQPLGPLGLVFCDMKVMDGAGHLSEKTAWQTERRGVDFHGSLALLIRNVVPGAGMLMGAELARRFPQIPENAIFHDHWFPLVASKIGSLKPLKSALYAYRIHGANVVGISEYAGIFAQKASDQKEGRGILAKCDEVWRRSRDFARAAQAQGVELNFWERGAFLRSWDLGGILFFYGFARVLSDPALARASWARAVGKLHSLFFATG